MAPTGQTGTQPPQSMQFSGSMYVIFSSTCKHSTGHTVTHSVYRQPRQLSVTTYAIAMSRVMRSELAALDKHVREGRRPAKVGVGGWRERVNGRSLAVGPVPVSRRRHDHSLHDVRRNAGEGLERTAVVEYPNRRSGHDAALLGVFGVKEHRLLLARLGGLRGQIAVVRVQEGVALGRDKAERIALGQRRRRLRVLVRRDVVWQSIHRRAVLVAVVALPEQRHDEVAAAGDARLEFALARGRRKITLAVRRPVVGRRHREPRIALGLDVLKGCSLKHGMAPIERRLDDLVV